MQQGWGGTGFIHHASRLTLLTAVKTEFLQLATWQGQL